MSKKEKVWSFGVMALTIMDSIMMGKNMVTVYTTGLMVLCMMDSGM